MFGYKIVPFAIEMDQFFSATFAISETTHCYPSAHRSEILLLQLTLAPHLQ
jgi:hypothetical protein